MGILHARIRRRRVGLVLRDGMDQMRYQLAKSTREAFIERFNEHGHATRVTAVQDTHANSTVTIFLCKVCDESGFVYSMSNSRWMCEGSKLDLKCTP